MIRTLQQLLACENTFDFSDEESKAIFNYVNETALHTIEDSYEYELLCGWWAGIDGVPLSRKEAGLD